MARTRNIENEIRALELRAAGETQREVAEKLDVSVRTVSRWESCWRKGDRPLPELCDFLWELWERDQNEWRRVRLLQSLMKGAIAHAEVTGADFEREVMSGARRDLLKDRESQDPRFGAKRDRTTASLDQTNRAGDLR